MKRSKIFLGVTTALLAVAGVAAAKHYSGSRTAFYVTNNTAPVKYCKQVTNIPCTKGGSNQCYYTVGTFPNQKFYTLFTKGIEGIQTTDNGKCTSLLQYITH